jgi:large subunit ribosomal protein L19
MAQHLQFSDTISFSVGDTIRVHQRIAEEKKTRVQIFEGVVIAIRGRENGKSIVVRKISSEGIGVERILPVHLPSIEKIEVKRHGSVRRAKLYFLRDKRGKSASKVKEKAVRIAAA